MAGAAPPVRPDVDLLPVGPVVVAMSWQRVPVTADLLTAAAHNFGAQNLDHHMSGTRKRALTSMTFDRTA